MIFSSPLRRFPRRLRASFLSLGCAIGIASLFTGSAAGVWTTNAVQLDNGTCGQNLQIGSDKTASSSSLPTFWLMGDGGLSKYDAFIDGVKIGTFNSAGNGNVCIATTNALADGAHTLTANELQPRPSMLVTPFAFTVDTVPPPSPSVPLLSAWSDSGVVGDGVTRYRNVNFTGTSQPLLSIQLYNGPAGLGGAKADAAGGWSATTTSLSDGTYYVGAAALDSAGNKSAVSSTAQVTIDGTAPATPGAPALDPGSDTAPAGDNTTSVPNPVVTGTSAADVTSVSVFSDGVQVGTAAPDTSHVWRYTLPALATGSHTIQINASDLAGNTSSLSTSLGLTIGAAVAGPPGTPSLDSATGGNGAVALAWSAPSYDGGSAITAYKIYRGTSSGNESLLTTVGNVTGWTDTNVSNGTTYWYQVSAVNSTGEGSRASERSATPAAPATFPAPPALAVVAAGNLVVNLSWNAPSSNGGSPITGYRIYRGTAAGGETLLATLGVVTSYADTNVVNGTTYWYQVSAVNAVGESSRSSEWPATPLTPATAPGTPALNSATPGNGSVALSWSAPSSDGGSAITGYKVYRGTASGGENLLATVGTGTSWTDSNAANGTAYWYQVSAINAVGEGSRSNERSATPTAPATVPATPALNSATAGNGSVALAWSAPANGGSAITAYKIYRGTSSGNESLLATVGTGTGWTDSNAANGTTYWYQVSAVNAVGEGSRSNERSATPVAPATVPGIPALNSATAGNGSVTLGWSAPSDGGSAITAYKIYRGTSSGNETLLATVGTGTGWTDSNASNGTTYWYQVSAVNALGEGSRSSERAATPSAPATVPGAATLNSATAGAGSVALSWSAPSDGGSAITAYKIYRGTSSGGEGLLATVGTGTGWTDSNASNGTTYWYQVSAVNALGEGSRSNERSATPSAPATAPGTPTLNSASAGSGSVALAWSAPSSDGGSAITNYRIYRATAAGGETLYWTLGNVTSWTDTGVVNGISYYYQVSAVNSVGEGLRSNERFATPTAAPTVPAAPPLNSATAGNGSVALAWSAPAANGSAITGYKVYRGTSSGNESLLATVGTGTSWTDSNASNGTTYWYQVSAVNGVGEGSRSNERSATPTAPASVPATPALNSTNAGNGSVALAWSAPSDGGSAITAYRIYRGTASGGETLLTTVGTGTSWTDGNASNGTTYWYQVSAVNGVGEGSRSNERSATPTAPATVPATATLNSANAGNGSVALAWSAPSDGGSAITAYKVYRGTASGGETLLTTVGTGTSWTDSNASNGTTYWYQVSAVNAVGEGSHSNERSATPTAPATVPGIPALNSASAGSGTVGLAWSAPSNGGSAITAYKIYRGTASGGETLLTTVGTGTSWTDSGVTNGTTYYYQVSAVNSVGEGSRSSERSATPTAAPTAPAAPSFDSATAGNGSVALAWSAPGNGGSAITGYKVYRATTSGGETLLATLGNVTSWTDTGVTNGSTYWYQVSAVNAVGEGGRSSERSATPVAPATAPGVPTLNSATASAGSVALAWSAPGSDGGSAITGYKVYRGTASGGEALLTTLGNATSWTDTNVASGTTYWYQVSAVNAVGESSRSGERSATTPVASGDTTAPSTPTNMTTLRSGTTQVVIDWSSSSDNAGVTGYQVYRDGALVATVANSYFLDSGLGAATGHTYQVRAIDAAGNRSAASTNLSAATMALGFGTTGTIAGVAFNAAGTPLYNALARVSGTTKLARTDRNGVWSFGMMAPGTYTVTTSYSSSASVSITAVAKQTTLAVSELP